MTTEMVRVTTPTCMLCKKASVFYLGADRLAKWRGGAYVQDAFPDLSAEEREMLVSGTHPECWNNLYPEEDN